MKFSMSLRWRDNIFHRGMSANDNGKTTLLIEGGGDYYKIILAKDVS